MLKIKRDINQQDLNVVDLHFVKSKCDINRQYLKTVDLHIDRFE